MACVLETRWVGTKIQDVDRFKLFYSGGVRGTNRIGILVDMELRKQVVEITRVKDRLMAIKLVVGGLTFNVISAYVSQAGIGEEVKSRFWEDLDEVVRGIPKPRSCL